MSTLLRLVTPPRDHKFTKWAAVSLSSLLRNKEALVFLGSYQSVEVVDICLLHFPPVGVFRRTRQSPFHLTEPPHAHFSVSAVQLRVLRKPAEALSQISPHHEPSVSDAERTILNK